MDVLTNITVCWPARSPDLTSHHFCVVAFTGKDYKAVPKTSASMMERSDYFIFVTIKFNAFQ